MSLEDYRNVPLTIGILVSERIATLHELDTVYGVEDMYDLLEIITVDAFNINKLRKTNANSN